MSSLSATAAFKKRSSRTSRPEIPHVDGRGPSSTATYGQFEASATGNIRIKDEPTDEIKDYAETTMNELLGWYGYDKVDSRDTQGLNLTHFRGTSNSPDHSGSDDAGSSSREGPAGGNEGAGPGSLTGTGSRPPTAGPTTPNGPPSTSPGPPEEEAGSAEDTSGLPSGCIVCAWCQKVGMKLFTLKTSNGSKAFCSELCFTQCRRASFKKNKVCDWCKHVRHTVNYVDFQVEVCNDGDQQLQFCSDKCLNQYKMNIFCRETQAHLQMHPHLQEAANKLGGSAAAGALNLITPDLWLRECKGSSTNGHSNDGSDEREETLPENLSVSAPSESLASAAPRKSVSPSSVSVPSNLRVDEPDPPRALSLPAIPQQLPRSHHRDKERSRRVKSSFRHKERRDHRHHSQSGVHGSSSHPRHSVTRSPSSTCSTPLSTSSANSHNHLANGPSSGSLNGLGLLNPGKHEHPPTTLSGSQPSSLNMAALHGPPSLGVPFPGMGDGLRSPFLPPNLLPNHLNFLAQQQMETLLRLQHNLGLRPGVPPMNLPAGMFPPLPHFPGGHRTMSPPNPNSAPPQPLPPPVPPRPPPPPPAMQHHSSHQHYNNHHSHKQNSHYHEHSKPSKSHHHSSSSHKSSSSSAAAASNLSSPSVPVPPPLLDTSTTATPTAAVAAALTSPQSVLPPVTVMVPYPILVPIPVPIPLVIPVPKDFLDRMMRQKNEKKAEDCDAAINLSNGGGDLVNKSEGKSSPKSDSLNGSPNSSKRVETVITKLVNSKRDKRGRTSSDGRDTSPPPLLKAYDRTSVLDLEDSTEDAESSTPLPDGFTSDDDNTLSDDSDLGKDDPLPGESRTFDTFKVKLKGSDLTASLVRETTRKRSPEKLDFSEDSFKRKCV